MKHLLVVDDARAIRAAIRRILESLGHAVDEAENGEQALTYCVEWGNVDAMLLDIDMPVMDGMSCLRALRRHPTAHQPKVVMCTTHASLDRVQEALEAGADEYIMKPFDADIVTSKLHAAGVL